MDGIYRANLRGNSTYVRAQAESVAAELLKGDHRVEPCKRNLVETRRQLESGWRTLADNLARDGHQDLAHDVQRFVDRMPGVKTERERITAALLEQARKPHIRDHQPSR